MFDIITLKDVHTVEMDLQRERRRSLNSLSLCRTGAIGLGLWSVIKAIMTFFANRNYIAEMISDIYTNSGVSEEEVSLKAVAFITYLIILAFLYWFFLFVYTLANVQMQRLKKGKYKFLTPYDRQGFLPVGFSFFSFPCIRYLKDV